MKLSKKAGLGALVVIALAALATHLIQKGIAPFGTSDRFTSQHFAVSPNSVSTGNTFQVKDGRKAITVSLCGIEALEQGHPLKT